MKKGLLSTLIKGFCVGASMLVPGVSGGSMALILGIYDDLIRAVSNIYRAPRRYGSLLLFFSLAAILGMVLIARPLLALYQAHKGPMLCFFLGAVAGSIPMIYGRAKPKKISPLVFVWPALGIFIIYAISQWSVEQIATSPGPLTLLLGGVLSAVALVLPGISVSFVWLLLDMYDSTAHALSTFDLGYLVPLGLGLLLGIFLTAHFLEQAMEKHPTPTYLIILGFLIGSLVVLFPGLPTGIGWLVCPLLFVAGLLLILLISKVSAPKAA